MSLDQVNEVADLSEATLNALVLRLERSTTLEQLIYRETEIDELWRLLGGTDADAVLPDMDAPRARQLREVILAVHDQVGVDGDAPGAAARLRQVLR